MNECKGKYLVCLPESETTPHFFLLDSNVTIVNKSSQEKATHSNRTLCIGLSVESPGPNYLGSSLALLRVIDSSPTQQVCDHLEHTNRILTFLWNVLT